MQTIDSATLAKNWIENQKIKYEHPEQFRLKSTGIISLDTALGGGLEPGQFVVIGGAQKSGKSTLLSCMAEAFARQDMLTLYLSGEMTNIQVANLFFSRMSRIDRTRIRAVNLEESDWVKLEKTADQFSEFSIWWNHGFSSVEDIVKIANEIEKKIQKSFDAILVDYIQLMEAPEIKGKGNRVQELGYISRNLKRLTINRAKPTIVVAAAQLNRTSIRGNLFDANAFLGTGDIERDMDVGMVIYPAIDPIQAVENKFMKNIKIVGSRETEVSELQVRYNGTMALIEDADLSNLEPKNYIAF